MAESSGSLSPAHREEIIAYLRAHWRSPEAYVVGAFRDHDVVLLGETHGIKHNLALVHALIPRLSAAGVHMLGMEFGAAEDQDDLDRLVTAETYDEDGARRLMFRYNVGWAYREYHDVYRHAWAFNRTLPPDAPRFRVVNLSYRYDWRHLRGPRTPYAMQRVFPKGNIEQFRAAVVEREVFARGQKMLVLTGTIHAFTRYRMPEYDYLSPGFFALRGLDFGNLLEARHPGRACTILLHSPWETPDKTRQVRPLGGSIDEVMRAFDDTRVGFDTLGSPFARIADIGSYYATGYPEYTLATIAAGYIYDRPFSAYEGCTVDEAFLTDANWAEARDQIPDPDWHGRPRTREEYMSFIRRFVDMDVQLREVR